MLSSLDTSVIVRVFVGDAPDKAEAAVKLIEAKKVAIADAAFIEAEHTLRSFYKYTREEIADSYGLLLGQSNIICNRPLLTKALHYYQKYPSESFVDCCLTVYAVLNDQAPLLTFDKNLAKHLPNAVLLT